MTCSTCRDPLLHCHEASVVHVDGTVGCVDPSCDAPHEVHLVWLHCEELELACSCGTPPPAVLPKAA